MGVMRIPLLSEDDDEDADEELCVEIEGSAILPLMKIIIGIHSTCKIVYSVGLLLAFPNPFF